MHNKNDHHQSRFLEALFVRMLRMRSASLKIEICGNYLFEFPTISKFKKKIVSAETILGNTVDGIQRSRVSLSTRIKMRETKFF